MKEEANICFRHLVVELTLVRLYSFAQYMWKDWRWVAVVVGMLGDREVATDFVIEQENYWITMRLRWAVMPELKRLQIMLCNLIRFNL